MKLHPMFATHPNTTTHWRNYSRSHPAENWYAVNAGPNAVGGSLRMQICVAFSERKPLMLITVTDYSRESSTRRKETSSNSRRKNSLKSERRRLRQKWSRATNSGNGMEEAGINWLAAGVLQLFVMGK